MFRGAKHWLIGNLAAVFMFIGRRLDGMIEVRIDKPVSFEVMFHQVMKRRGLDDAAVAQKWLDYLKDNPGLHLDTEKAAFTINEIRKIRGRPPFDKPPDDPLGNCVLA